MSVITDAAGRVRDKATNMFVSTVDKAKAAVTEVEERIATNETNATGADDEYAALTARVAAGEQVDDVADVLAGINQRRQFYKDLRAPLQRELEKTQRALFDAEDSDRAKKRDAQRKADLRSYRQHTAEAKHTAVALPDFLAGVHQCVVETQAALDKAGALSGHDPANVLRLLGRAIRAAGLEDIFKDAIQAARGPSTTMDGVTGEFVGGKFVPAKDTEIRAFNDELGAALKKSDSDYALALGQRELTSEEVAERQEAEREAECEAEALRRRIRETEYHMHRLETDPSYYAQHFHHGEVPPPPPGDVSHLVQRAAEHGTAAAFNSAMRGPSDDRQPDPLAQIADKYRYPTDALKSPEPTAPSSEATHVSSQPTSEPLAPAAGDDEYARRTKVLEAVAAEARAEWQRWENQG